MKVISVNLGEKRKVKWKSKIKETGIFKQPVTEITLGSTDVEKDSVVDRKYHGGVDKACYLFSADVYNDWKEKYPDLDWDWGMFGENITVAGLDESKIMIGAIYQLGKAVVEVSEPRQPCSTLGIRFNTQQVIKDFIAAEHSGVYLRVIQPGRVKATDTIELISEGEDISIRDVFRMIYKKETSPNKIAQALASEKLAQSSKKCIK